MILRGAEAWARDEALPENTTVVARGGRMLVQFADGSTGLHDADTRSLPSRAATEGRCQRGHRARRVTRHHRNLTRQPTFVAQKRVTEVRDPDLLWQRVGESECGQHLPWLARKARPTPASAPRPHLVASGASQESGGSTHQSSSHRAGGRAAGIGHLGSRLRGPGADVVYRRRAGTARRLSRSCRLHGCFGRLPVERSAAISIGQAPAVHGLPYRAGPILRARRPAWLSRAAWVD